MMYYANFKTSGTRWQHDKASTNLRELTKEVRHCANANRAQGNACVWHVYHLDCCDRPICDAYGYTTASGYRGRAHEKEGEILI